MPAISSWFRWLRTVDGLQEQYDRACEDRAAGYAEEIVDIADDSSQDTITKVGKDGQEYETINTEWVARSRLRVDSRKWVASRLLPKYRDKQDLNHGGNVTVTHEMDFTGMPQEGDDDDSGAD